jgi:hypothetical protein
MITTLAFQEQLFKSIDYISNLYRLVNGPDTRNLRNYLSDLFATQVNSYEESNDFDETTLILDGETHRLWSAFVYDYFGRERDYSNIPKLSESKLLEAQFTLKVNDNPLQRDKQIFNDILFAKQMNSFTLSDIVIGTDQDARYHTDNEKYVADQLRYMLQESEIRFIDSNTEKVFLNIWKEIMNRDTSGFSALFTTDMLEMLARTFIPLYTVYDPGNEDKWEFIGEEEINLAEIWQQGDLAKFEYQPDNGFLHYKLTWKSNEDKYFEAMFDVLKLFTSNLSRSVQKLWMQFKAWAHWMYRVFEKY